MPLPRGSAPLPTNKNTLDSASVTISRVKFSLGSGELYFARAAEALGDFWKYLPRLSATLLRPGTLLLFILTAL